MQPQVRPASDGDGDAPVVPEVADPPALAVEDPGDELAIDPPLLPPPAEQPRLVVATLLVQRELWWRNASQIAAEVLRRAFCADGRCGAENAERWRSHPETTAQLPARDASS